MKTLLFMALFTSLSSMAAGTAPPIPIPAPKPTSLQVYRLHLFFDDKEFVDELEVVRDQTGRVLSGRMLVPRDFIRPIQHITDLPNAAGLMFDVPVPKNASRPKDLVFTYNVTYFDRSQKQMTGFVQMRSLNPYSHTFVASFVAFLQPPGAPRLPMN